MPTETPHLGEPNREPQPIPTVEEPTHELGLGGLYLYRNPEGVFTFSYPADCGRMVDGMMPDGSHLAGNSNNCPGNDGEIDVELETNDLAEDEEELPLSPEWAAEQVANAPAGWTDDAHRETLTTDSGDTLEIVRNALEAWGNDKIVMVTAIQVSAGWHATDITMSY